MMPESLDEPLPLLDRGWADCDHNEDIVSVHCQHKYEHFMLIFIR